MNDKATSHRDESQIYHYFLNTGFAHGVYNEGDEPRIAFMFSLDGQNDITDIRL